MLTNRKAIRKTAVAPMMKPKTLRFVRTLGINFDNGDNGALRGNNRALRAIGEMGICNRLGSRSVAL